MNQIKTLPLVNTRRRNFIKWGVFVVLAFVAGKLFEPLMNTITGDKVISQKTFSRFTMTETGRHLKITDKDGNDLLIFEKDSF